MKFGAVRPREAEGAIAVHSIRKDGFTLKKGTLIGRSEVAALEAAKVGEIVVARLEPGDVSEDTAAATSSPTSPGSSRATTISPTSAASSAATSFPPISVPFFSVKAPLRIECTAIAPSASRGGTAPNFIACPPA